MTIVNAAPKPHKCVVEFEALASVDKSCKVNSKKGMIRRTAGILFGAATGAITIARFIAGV